MESRIITTADLAHLLLTTPKTVACYAKAGVVKRRGRGKFDEVASVRGFARFMRASRPKGATTSAAVSAERAGLLSVQRRKGELDLAKAKGDLVSKTEIMRDFDENMKHVQLQLSMLHGYLVNSGIDRKLATMVVDKVLEGVKIIEDGGSLHEHGGYDREGRAFYPDAHA